MFDFYLGLPHVCYYVQRGSISHWWVNVMEWEPSKSYQALTCEHVLTYELNHMWLPPKHIISPTPPPPPTPTKPEERPGTHGLCPMCITQGLYGI